MRGELTPRIPIFRLNDFLFAFRKEIEHFPLAIRAQIGYNIGNKEKAGFDMMKKILILVLITAMLALSSCKVVEVIDHGTTAPEGTTEPQKEYSPWGFWFSNDSLSAIELVEGSSTAKIYSIKPGYYAYESVEEVSCTYDGNSTFTCTHGDETYVFTFDKFANTLTWSDGKYTATYLSQKDAPTKHPEYAYPDYTQWDPTLYITLGDIDFAGIRTLAFEGAPYEIALAAYGDISRFPLMSEVSRPAKSGDCVNIDYCGKLDGVAFSGGTAKNVQLFLSDYDNGYIPGFTEGIIGHSVGQTFDVDVTFPENYGAADLAGKAVVFTMTLNGICDLSVSDKDVESYPDNDYKTYDEWLKGELAEIGQSLFADFVLKACTKVDTLPTESYVYFYQQIVDYYHSFAYYYGIDYAMLLSYSQITETAILQQALNQATYNMALRILAKENKLAWTEDDFEQEYESYVENYLETYKEATREEACKYADKHVTQMKQELTEQSVLVWAATKIFPSAEE